MDFRCGDVFINVYICQNLSNYIFFKYVCSLLNVSYFSLKVTLLLRQTQAPI